MVPYGSTIVVLNDIGERVASSTKMVHCMYFCTICRRYKSYVGKPVNVKKLWLIGLAGECSTKIILYLLYLCMYIFAQIVGDTKVLWDFGFFGSQNYSKRKTSKKFLSEIQKYS